MHIPGHEHGGQVPDFERLVGVIIQNEGCLVEDEYLGNGRRQRRDDDKVELVGKPRARQSARRA